MGARYPSGLSSKGKVAILVIGQFTVEGSHHLSRLLGQGVEQVAIQDGRGNSLFLVRQSCARKAQAALGAQGAAEWILRGKVLIGR